MNSADYLIVGSGLTGSVIARLLADAGREVLILERRSHLGGNVHDHTHDSGIRIHTYGPHYFRTSSDRIWDFVTRFAPFYRYEGFIRSLVDGKLENWPVAGSYIRQHIGENWKPEFTGTPSNFEEAALSLMPRKIYEEFVKEYNEKQWGVPATELSAELCKRFDVRLDDEPRLTPHSKYQGIPEPGYAELMRRMVEGVPVVLNCDYLQRRDEFRARKMLIFTGSIDAFFNHRLGRLSYRGQKRQEIYRPDVDYVQPCAQVNNPSHAGGPHLRTLEWKYMMPPRYAGRIKGTVLTRETAFTPTDPDNFEYPFPDRENARRYEEYRKLSVALSDVLICGRLGEYRYFDMDQAIARAIMLAERLLEEKRISKAG